ncbi:MAG: hypothetical protein DRJ03_03975 [Chloroflexi bacterium]|nr:MAG: hypothetical protein DRJ03_03975 [Chloroflexota bacterium]
MIQETSLEAYLEVKPRLGEKQKEVYRLLKNATRVGFDMTNMEIAQALKWSINRVTPRVYELRQSGLVVLSQKRKCGVTGRRAMAWRVR